MSPADHTAAEWQEQVLIADGQVSDLTDHHRKRLNEHTELCFRDPKPVQAELNESYTKVVCAEILLERVQARRDRIFLRWANAQWKESN